MLPGRQQKLVDLPPAKADGDVLFGVLPKPGDDEPLGVLFPRAAVRHKEVVGPVGSDQLGHSG